MSTRKENVYAKTNKQTFRYYNIFGNYKYHSSSIFN